jgi:PST family polysaccharide transporter
MLVIPMGVGIFVYKELITNILLGEQWSEAIDFIGLWGFMTAVSIIFGYYSSEAYRSKGYPKLSFLAQVLHLVVLIPVIYLSAQKGYETLIFAKSYIRIQYVLVHLLIMHFVLHISMWKMIHNVLPSFLCAGVMGAVGLTLKGLNQGIAWDLCSIGICIMVYFMLIMLFPKNRNELITIIKKFINMKDLSKLRGEGI